jgi:transcriptional adapter 2-alpha
MICKALAVGVARFTKQNPDTETWQADEELLLVEAIDMYGLGNWPAVAEHIGTKSKEAARNHYCAVYLMSASFPEPQPMPEMAGVRTRC